MPIAHVRKKRIAAVTVLAVLWFVVSAAPSPAGPLGKRIELPNGMVLLLAEQHEVPLVTVSMIIRAGRIDEPADKPGLASLTASLLTQGTTRRSAGRISSEIDFIGGSLSVSGGDDYATAGLRVLKKDILTGFDLLSDVLMHPAFDQKEIDRKVRETLAGIRRRKEEPEAIANEAFAKTVFGRHPYGRTDDDVAAYLPKLTRRDLVDFYASHYGPNEVILAVAGDVTEREVLRLVDEYFAGWKAAEPQTVAVPTPPAIAKTTFEKLDKDITQANIAIGGVGISRGNPDYYAAYVMNYILGGGGFSSRLMDNIRDTRGLAYDVHSSFDALKEPGAFEVWLQTKNGSANEAITQVFAELKRMRTSGVTDGELEDAKSYLTGSFPLRMDTSAKVAGMLSAIEFYGLGLDYPERYPRLINAVTRDDVLRAARKYIDPDRMAVIVLGNQEKIKLRH